MPANTARLTSARQLSFGGKVWTPFNLKNGHSIFSSELCMNSIFKTSSQLVWQKHYFTWRWPWHRSHIQPVTCRWLLRQLKWTSQDIKTVDTDTDMVTHPSTSPPPPPPAPAKVLSLGDETRAGTFLVVPSKTRLNSWMFRILVALRSALLIS